MLATPCRSISFIHSSQPRGHSVAKGPAVVWRKQAPFNSNDWSHILPMAKAEITIHVSQFVAVTDMSDARRFCLLDITKGEGGVQITNSAAGRVYQLQGDRTLRVRRRLPLRIDLEFTVTSPLSCRVAGVILNREGFDETGAVNNFKLDWVKGNQFSVLPVS